MAAIALQVCDAAGKELEALPVDGQVGARHSSLQAVHALEGQRPLLWLQVATVFGRTPACADVVLADASCSRQHAALVHHQDTRIFIIDLQSVRCWACGAVTTDFSGPH